MFRKPSGDEDAPPVAKSQLPVVIGSFLTGVAAMTLVGVVAPAIAAAAAPDAPAVRESAAPGFSRSPVAFTEISEEQRQEMEARLEAAERALAGARLETDRALARLDRLTPE